MVNYWSNTQLFMSHLYWAITGQYSIINYPITGFVNTSRFTTLVTTLQTIVLYLTQLALRYI